MSMTKISLVQWLITNLNVILYLSTCHTVYINVLTLFMIMPSLIINSYVSLMYELKIKIGKVFTSKFVRTGPSSYKKRIYQAAVSQRLRNTGLDNLTMVFRSFSHPSTPIILRLLHHFIIRLPVMWTFTCTCVGGIKGEVNNSSTHSWGASLPGCIAGR